MSAPAPRLPLAPLADALGIELLADAPPWDHDPVRHVGAQRLADVLAVEERTICRWKLDGIPITAARLIHLEDLCDDLRRHPATVWGQAWWRAIDQFVPGDDDDGFPPLDDVWPIGSPCQDRAA